MNRSYLKFAEEAEERVVWVEKKAGAEMNSLKTMCHVVKSDG